jgi:ankyrin repeat protein
MDLVKTFAQKFLENPAANEYPTLRAACEQGHVSVIKLFFKTFCPKVDILQLFHKACCNNDVQTVEMLVESVADINRCSDSILNPLQQASYHGHVNIVKILILAGANINERDKDGWTPFHCACRNDHFKVAKFLIDAGADPNIPNYKGHTALYMLCKEYGKFIVDETEKFKFIKKLLEIPQIDVSKPTRFFGKTPLYQACKRGYEKIVKLLLPRVKESDLEIRNSFKIPIRMRKKLEKEVKRRFSQRKAVQLILFSQCKTGHLSSLSWDIVRHEIGKVMLMPTHREETHRLSQPRYDEEPPRKKMKK